MSWQKKIQITIICSLLLFFGLLTARKINLVTADLGRHLKNGELVLQGDPLQIWRANFYSYTYPDYPFLNHHWGSGVIFYLIQKVFGFAGLSIFFTLLTLTTFLFFFRVAWKNSRFGVAVLVSLLVLPLLGSRIEIRPEAFSYFLAGGFLFILEEIRERGEIGRRRLIWLLPALELIWVNLHIYFFLGLFLVGVFFLEELFLVLKRGRRLGDLSCLSNLGIVLGLSFVASFVNPAGLKGVLYPLQIFKDYGYRLFENQSVWFLDKLVKYPPSLYFKIAFGVLVLSWIYVFVKKKSFSFYNLLASLPPCLGETGRGRSGLFTICFSFMGWTAVRNFTLFGYFAIPIIAANLSEIGKSRGIGEERAQEYFTVASLAVSLAIVLFVLNPSYWQGRISIGVGLEEGNTGAADFFQKEDLHGPIFNNYDNGGYLIYFLYPKEKVFVDNRPEAYPKEFFEKTYIPMQESEEKWREVEKEYHFNAIFFYRHDLTPWGQNFLVSKIKDSAWVPVYVDDWSIIFVKRNIQNQALIKKYELPKEIFSVK